MYEHKDGIRFRKMSIRDLRQCLELKAESWWGTHKTPIISMDDQHNWINSIPNDQLYLIAEWSVSEGTPEKPIVTNDKATRSKIALKADDSKGNVWCLRESIGVAVYTDIDHLARTCKISGSVYKEFRKSEIVKAGFSAGVDFAFEILNMHRIESEVLSYHVASQKLQFDLGFRVEGKKVEAVYKCGKYYDSLILAMLRKEWENTPRVCAYGDTCNYNFSHNRMVLFEERAIRDEGSMTVARPPLPE